MPPAWTVAAGRRRQSLRSVQIHVRVLALYTLSLLLNCIVVTERPDKTWAVASPVAAEAQKLQFRGTVVLQTVLGEASLATLL